MKLLLSTTNEHKVKEYNEILSKYGIEVLLPKALNINVPEINETGKTFKANALLKAKALSKLTNLPVIADDSGLCVKALKNKPGLYSSRFVKKCGGQKEANQKIVCSINSKKRDAKFICVIALIINGKAKTFKGIAKGYIVDSYNGQLSFGYDPIFIAKSVNKTYHNLTSEEKNTISHRALACIKLIKYLNRQQ